MPPPGLFPPILRLPYLGGPALTLLRSRFNLSFTQHCQPLFLQRSSLCSGSSGSIDTSRMRSVGLSRIGTGYANRSSQGSRPGNSISSWGPSRYSFNVRWFFWNSRSPGISGGLTVQSRRSSLGSHVLGSFFTRSSSWPRCFPSIARSKRRFHSSFVLQLVRLSLTGGTSYKPSGLRDNHSSLEYCRHDSIYHFLWRMSAEDRS